MIRQVNAEQKIIDYWTFTRRSSAFDRNWYRDKGTCSASPHAFASREREFTAALLGDAQR